MSEEQKHPDANQTPPSSDTPHETPPPSGTPRETPPSPPPSQAAPPPPPSSTAGSVPPPPPPSGTPVRGTPPSGQRPGPDRSQQAQEQAQELVRQAEGMLTNIGVDIPLAIQSLIIAVAAGVLAALLDEILGLPTNALRLAFGWMGLIAALSGMVYALVTRKEDLAALVVGMASGAVAYLVWFIVMEIIADVYGFNIFKALFSGLILGAIGVGWLMLMRILPKRLPR